MKVFGALTLAIALLAHGSAVARGLGGQDERKVAYPYEERYRPICEKLVMDVAQKMYGSPRSRFREDSVQNGVEIFLRKCLQNGPEFLTATPEAYVAGIVDRREKRENAQRQRKQEYDNFEEAVDLIVSGNWRRFDISPIPVHSRIESLDVILHAEQVASELDERDVAVLLGFSLELTGEEISALTQVPISSVYKRRQSALKRLATVLDLDSGRLSPQAALKRNVSQKYEFDRQLEPGGGYKEPLTLDDVIDGASQVFGYTAALAIASSFAVLMFFVAGGMLGGLAYGVMSFFSQKVASKPSASGSNGRASKQVASKSAGG